MLDLLKIEARVLFHPMVMCMLMMFYPFPERGYRLVENWNNFQGFVVWDGNTFTYLPLFFVAVVLVVNFNSSPEQAAGSRPLGIPTFWGCLNNSWRMARRDIECCVVLFHDGVIWKRRKQSKQRNIIARNLHKTPKSEGNMLSGCLFGSSAERIWMITALQIAFLWPV